MIRPDYTEATAKLAGEIVKLDAQLARAIVRAGRQAMKKPTAGGVKLYLLSLAVEQLLAQSAPTPTARRRRKPQSKPAGNGGS